MCVDVIERQREWKREKERERWREREREGDRGNEREREGKRGRERERKERKEGREGEIGCEIITQNYDAKEGHKIIT